MDIRLLFRDCKYSSDQTPLNQHYHDNYEVLYIRNGISSLKVGDRSYTLKRGSLVFISRLEDHSITILSGNYERYFIIICSERLDQLIGDTRLASIFRNRPPSYSHVFDVSAYADDLDRCFSGIVQEFNEKQLYCSDLVSILLKQILIYAYRACPDRFSYESDRLHTQIYMVQHYIESNFQNDIKISDLASKNFISLHYFSRSFKQQTGYSPKQYLVYTRLAHAKALLCSTKLSVGDVTIQCGFSDVNNFIRTFKKCVGVTPLKFKKRI
ncbi:MAG: hypothetical protein A2029_05795 [Chloroflexi bacterium RBG_19FT_COMBO_47_9]|nr:MAG: hypothetical protein A2Y53_06150 [Chloroflexi bacterium RBG_16_47_49]OGO59978.1 MAG: hypothetical protein A2029_05795 [Chloroflexi bacterium RBG_19FT_COMBO_47_9]